MNVFITDNLFFGWKWNKGPSFYCIKDLLPSSNALLMTLIMLIPGSSAKDIDKSCETFVVFFFPNTAVTNWMISLISVNRLLALPRWNLAEKYYTWKLCGAYFVGFWIVSFTFLTFPLTGAWGEVQYQPQTFSCTIDKGPLTYFSVIGKFEKKVKFYSWVL